MALNFLICGRKDKVWVFMLERREHFGNKINPFFFYLFIYFFFFSYFAPSHFSVFFSSMLCDIIKHLADVTCHIKLSPVLSHNLQLFDMFGCSFQIIF